MTTIIPFAAASALLIYGSEDLLQFDSVYETHDTGEFVAIRKMEFVIGTVISRAHDTDVPYIDGRVTECSTKAQLCKSVGALYFIVPTGQRARAQRLTSGAYVNVRRNKDGSWSGVGVCQAANAFGCFTRRSGFPSTKWQYHISKDLRLKSITIEYTYSKKSLGAKRYKLMRGKGLELR